MLILILLEDIFKHFKAYSGGESHLVSWIAFIIVISSTIKKTKNSVQQTFYSSSLFADSK